MILETDVFEMWMGKIMERFDRHERLSYGQGGQGDKISGRRTVVGQSGLVPTPPSEQTLAATLPQFGHIALPDAMA